MEFIRWNPPPSKDILSKKIEEILRTAKKDKWEEIICVEENWLGMGGAGGGGVLVRGLACAKDKTASPLFFRQQKYRET